MKNREISFTFRNHRFKAILFQTYLVDNEIKHFKDGFCVSTNTIMSFWSYEVIFRAHFNVIHEMYKNRKSA